MKYRAAIYDLDYEIEAKSTEGAIRAAIARYAKTETAQCSPDRLTRGPTVAEGREWEVVSEKSGSNSATHLGRWVPCKYIQGAASIQIHQLAALEREATTEPA
jgi:hypothetical protein